MVEITPSTPEVETIRTAAQPKQFSEARLVTNLIAHPGMAKFTNGYSAQDLSVLSERGESAYIDPLMITHENVIIEGYALWQLAKLQKRAEVMCIVRHMNLDAALIHLLRCNRGSKGISDYVRVLIALELEPYFRERAKSNQRQGGREKGSSHLAEAERLDVRLEVARAAGVSSGNVSKVKHILQSAIPGVQAALVAGEIRINRAANWAGHPAPVQASYLSDYRNEHGIRSTINLLLRKHHPRDPGVCAALREIQSGLGKLQSDQNLFPLKSILLTAITHIDQLLTPQEGKRAA